MSETKKGRQESEHAAEEIDSETQNENAEAILLDLLKESPRPHFSLRKIKESIYAQTVRRRLGLPKGDKTNLAPIMVQAAKSLRKQLPSFSISMNCKEWYGSSTDFEIELSEGAEWADALREAWRGQAPHTENYLSGASVELLKLVDSKRFADRKELEEIICRQIGLPARGDIQKCLEEIVIKTGKDVKWEATGSHWDNNRNFRIWIESDRPAIWNRMTGLNPVISIDFRRYSRKDIDEVSGNIHRMILEAAPNGELPLVLLKIGTNKEFCHCFPRPEAFEMSGWLEFLKGIPFHPSLELCYDFRPIAPLWYVAVLPRQDWPTSLASIREDLAKPSLEERFGLSIEAAKFVRWIEGLREKEMAGSYSPIVEDEREKRIGIESPWGTDNFEAYLLMLVEEINQKTDYDLRLQSWQHWSTNKHRVRIGRKQSEVDDILKRLLWLAAKNNRTFDINRGRALIESLVGSE